MRNRPITIGAKRMINSTTKNISVGSVIGRYSYIFSISLISPLFSFPLQSCKKNIKFSLNRMKMCIFAVYKRYN